MSAQSSSLESTFTRTWARRGLLACALWPLSLLFGALTALRRAMYAAGFLKTTRLPVPVIVVGNVFVGGTGKTPLTIWLVDALRRAGYVPAVISRGYGTQNELPLAVAADADTRTAGDEPLLIARRAQCPVMVGRNRVQVAQALLAAYPDVNVIVSDDGLQHYAMERDIEIVVFDARGDGNGWLLPAGPLREPASRRRDFTVVNSSKPVPDFSPDAISMHLQGDIAERLTDRAQRQSLATLAGSGERIVAAAGIGNPARFFAMLSALGVVFEPLPLPDHFDFSLNPFAALTADIILITEKDAVKCSQIEALKTDPRLWVVPVTAHLDGALAERIVEKLRGPSFA